MSEHKRWTPGTADKIADFCDQHGMGLVPWQRAFLNKLEQRDTDATFFEMVAPAVQGGEHQP